jgi:hypothetical protein
MLLFRAADQVLLCDVKVCCQLCVQDLEREHAARMLEAEAAVRRLQVVHLPVHLAPERHTYLHARPAVLCTLTGFVCHPLNLVPPGKFVIEALPACWRHVLLQIECEHQLEIERDRWVTGA